MANVCASFSSFATEIASAILASQEANCSKCHPDIDPKQRQTTTGATTTSIGDCTFLNARSERHALRAHAHSRNHLNNKMWLPRRREILSLVPESSIPSITSKVVWLSVMLHLAYLREQGIVPATDQGLIKKQRPIERMAQGFCTSIAESNFGYCEPLVWRLNMLPVSDIADYERPSAPTCGFFEIVN